MTDNNLSPEILDKITKTCTCKAISRATIKESIRSGSHKLDDVIKDTGACTGGCKGYRCKDKIQDLINSQLNNN